MLLEINHLEKVFRTRFSKEETRALQDVDFKVEQGEFIAIMGESGSGKTTLLNILATLEKPTNGQVILNGEDITKIKEAKLASFRLKNLGFVFQDFNLLDTLSVRDNIYLPLVLDRKRYKEMDHRLSELSSHLRIDDLLDKRPFELSGGQKQRVAIARSLITNPQILLADEPTAALDYRNSEDLLNLFETINLDGQTILMVTHSANAASHAKRVLFIKDGRIFHQLSIDQYIPFLLASLLLYSLTCSTLLILMSAVGRDMGTAATVLFLGVIVLSIFAVVMEHYSYNILMKQRSSEFGLYNILGMNKRQVARVASLELFIIYIFVISIGSLFSAFFAKFIYLIFVNIINYHALNLSLSLWPFIICIVIFTGIFLTLEVPVIRHVHLSSPLSLFRKKQQGEKEPKGNLILAILALVAIAIAYTMALTSGKAPALAVIYRFFFAVLLVIAGTYLFYISFMTWYLKRLRQNKHYYYKSEHFVSTSQMIFRMKQNAVGLASITLLAVMALVTIATTVSLYSNTQNVVTGLFPKSVSLSIDNSKGDAKNIFEEKILKKLGKSSKEAITYNQTMISMPVSQSSELNITSKNVKHVDITKTGFMYLITQNDFRRLGHRLPKLKDNQVAYFVQKGDSRLKKINLLGNKFDVVKNLKEAYVPETTNTYNPGLIIFANNKQIDNIRKAYLPYTKNINTFPKTFKAYLDLNSQEINSISKNDIIEVDGKYVGNISTKQSFLKEGYQMFGGLLFTGFLLGISFLLGIALIVYYKQYSEGHEDKRSYRILQEVGMSKKLVKRTINSQIMIFFFQPLVVAVIHFGVAIPMLKQMLLVFGVLNSTIVYVVSGLTVLAISIIYFIIYRITSRTYYHIIER